jgi:hypothetical protein
MTKRDVLRLLAGTGIPVVIVGGLALRLYGSRSTAPDTCLAMRHTDVDDVMALMYASGHLLVTGLAGHSARIAPDMPGAMSWVEATRPGSMTFVEARSPATGARLPLRAINPATQVAFLFDLAVPFPRLKAHARALQVGGAVVHVASAEHLLCLEEARAGRTITDPAGLSFLRDLVG